MDVQKKKILVVEDDGAIARGLIHNLEYEGYEVRGASHGQAVMPMVAEFVPDLIILDVMLPGRSGFEILKDLRASGNDVHVIILSARTGESDKVEGMRLGADDYVSKPFGLREFLARVAAAMRRIGQRRMESARPLEFGDLALYPESMTVTRGGDPIKLTPRGLDLLGFFARHPNRIYSREALIEHVWGEDYDGTNRTIDNFAVQIRSQIEVNPGKPCRLETVYGLGYRFVG